MKLNFAEIIKAKTDSELEQICRDHVFYSGEERLLAMGELESRKELSVEMASIKGTLTDALLTQEEDLKPKHTLSLADLFPRQNYWVTPVLLYINVLIFLIMVLTGTGAFEPQIGSLIRWGGNIRPLVLGGEYWRLLSSVFIHAGLFHLAFNMFALIYVGAVLEPALGNFKYLTAYLLAGLLASVSSMVFNNKVVSVGASGAIFGLFGLLVVLLLKRDFRFSDISKNSLLFSVGLFIFYNLFYGFTNTGIDNAAHIGGLVTGLLTGLVFAFFKRPDNTTA